jgi:hypothetical protein
MNIYNIINKLRPYFFSLRELESNVSLDLKLPLTWETKTVIVKYPSVGLKIQDKNDKFNLVSLVTLASEEGYGEAFLCALEIVSYNKEQEEKERLFNDKVKELKDLFQKESINKLRVIKFTNEEEFTTGFGLASEGDAERLDANGDEQAGDDSRSEDVG